MSDVKQDLNWINCIHVLMTGILWGISYYCRQSLSVIVDVLEDDLNTTSSGVASLSSAILLPFCIMQIPAGLVLQIFSPEFSMAIGVLGIGIFSIIFGFVESLFSGIIVNILIGISASLVGLGPFTIAEERYGLQYVAFIVAIIQGIGILVAVSCQYIQSTIYQDTNEWRTMYWYYGLATIFLGVLYIFYMFIEAKCCRLDYNIIESPRSPKEQKEYSAVNVHAVNTESRPKAKVHVGLIRIWRSLGVDGSDKGKLKRMIVEMKSALIIAICNPWNWLLGIYGIFISAMTFGLSILWLIPYLILKFNYQRSVASLVNGTYTFSWAIGSVLFGKLILIKCCRARKLVLLIGMFYNLYATA